MKVNSLKKYLTDHKRLITIFLLLFAGFVVRLYLSRYGNDSGDILAFAKWGERFWELDRKDFYYERDWYYTYPTYHPISNFLFGFLNWLNQNRYILAEIHNKTRLIPSSFIIFFGEIDPGNPFMYNKGYFMLLKLPTILADLGVSLIVYKIILEITKNSKKALLGFIFYLFNPLTIFLSSIWGQTESLLALFGLLGFYFLVKKKIYLAIPLMFISMYIKPTWIVFAPLLLMITYFSKSKMKHLLLGALLSLILFLIFTLPFSGNNIFGFTTDILMRNMIPTSKGASLTSVSAFNLYTIFTTIDKTSATEKVLLSYETWGYLFYIILNVIIFAYLRKGKLNLEKMIFGVFFIGLGSFLFMTNMLERYFFAAFPALVVLMFTDTKKMSWAIIMNLLLFANLVWAFYRRSVGSVDAIFVSKNFLLVKLTSLLLIASWYVLTEKYIKLKKVLLQQS